MHWKEFERLMVKLNILATENDDLWIVFQVTINENKRLTHLVNSWNKSFVYIGKIHEMQKLIGDKTGLNFSNNEWNSSEASNYSFLDKDKSKLIHFV